MRADHRAGGQEQWRGGDDPQAGAGGRAGGGGGDDRDARGGGPAPTDGGPAVPGQGGQSVQCSTDRPPPVRGQRGAAIIGSARQHSKSFSGSVATFGSAR